MIIIMLCLNFQYKPSLNTLMFQMSNETNFEIEQFS